MFQYLWRLSAINPCGRRGPIQPLNWKFIIIWEKLIKLTFPSKSIGKVFWGQTKDTVCNVHDRQMAASPREEMMSNNNPGVTWQHLHQTRPDWWFYHSIESSTERPWTFRNWSIIVIIFHIKGKRTLTAANIWATVRYTKYSLPFYLSSVINVRRFQPEYFEKVKLEKLKY